MSAGIVELLQSSGVSVYLRQSIWLYPLVNAGHIIGLGLLIGSIVPLDLRLSGYWRGVPVAMLARVLLPTAVTGLVLAVVCGLLLFVARPGDYMASTLFITKLCLISLGLLNATFLRTSSAWKNTLKTDLLTNRVRVHGALSIVVWISVVIFGRLVGYR